MIGQFGTHRKPQPSGLVTGRQRNKPSSPQSASLQHTSVQRLFVPWDRHCPLAQSPGFSQGAPTAALPAPRSTQAVKASSGPAGAQDSGTASPLLVALPQLAELQHGVAQALSLPVSIQAPVAHSSSPPHASPGAADPVGAAHSQVVRPALGHVTAWQWLPIAHEASEQHTSMHNPFAHTPERHSSRSSQALPAGAAPRLPRWNRMACKQTLPAACSPGQQIRPAAAGPHCSDAQQPLLQKGGPDLPMVAGSRQKPPAAQFSSRSQAAPSGRSPERRHTPAWHTCFGGHAGGPKAPSS